MVWNFDPILVNFGPLKIHYYGVIFATGIFIGYLLWRWQMIRQGFSEQETEDFVIWAFLAVIIGARLGHCFFYEPSYYLSHPIEIFAFWKGGLASHGAAIALLLVLYAYHRAKKIPLLKICDCFSFAAAVGAIAGRIGNFFNSEIVGRVTNVAWAVKFPRYARMMGYSNVQPRHPSQLYEVFLGIVVLSTLLLTDRKYGKNRPTGLLGGLFLVVYFSGRFIVEFFKEYQALVQYSPQTQMQEPTFALTMGQLLSIPFILAGIVLVYKALHHSEEK